MMRQILTWIRDFIDKILWKTQKQYTYSSQLQPEYGYRYYPDSNSWSITNCTFNGNNSDGIWLYGSADSD